uniref:Secreted protein n=1 Tax=Pipistrellus kuhlii TaxID=59472 RepID=A0A7J7VN86_PIPKU|nr:hypothetical protein mPipKuh1_008415 [Pipistrellus kuhlii]
MFLFFNNGIRCRINILLICLLTWLCSSKLTSGSDMTDMKFCNIETFRWALFSYVLLDYTPLSIYVSCHTCYYFVFFSVTTKKGALLFCVPYTTQMQGPLPGHPCRTFQKFKSFWNIHNKSAAFKDCFEKD